MLQCGSLLHLLLGTMSLSPSVHNYKFSFVLPPALPSSIEGDFGFIRYSVNVHLDRPLWSDQRFHRFFTVLKPLNLNDENDLKVCEHLRIKNFNLNICFPQHPLVISSKKKFFICCLFRVSGLLHITASIPVRGYVPGQTIDLSLQVNNRCDQTIQKFTVDLIKVKNGSWRKTNQVMVSTFRTYNTLPNIVMTLVMKFGIVG